MDVEKITVLLVDDHAWVRGSVAQALSLADDIEVVGQAANGEEGVKKAKELSPDVVVMDLDMPVLGGVEATRQIREAVPSTQVLVLTVSESESDLFAAMAAGAKGYLLKNAGAVALHTAVMHISQGGVLVSPIMATTMLTQLTEVEAKTAKTETGLSPREEEVLQ
ncbi:MAG: response regulator transcription factor, partial [Dehalococcoidia bacterium]